MPWQLSFYFLFPLLVLFIPYFMQRCSVSENNWLSNSVYSPHKSCRGRSIRTGQTMKNVSLHLFLLFLQIFFASEEGSHVGDLIRTKSGKVFLRRSSKKAISPKKDAKEGGQHDSDDKESKVTKIPLKNNF